MAPRRSRRRHDDQDDRDTAVSNADTHWRWTMVEPRGPGGLFHIYAFIPVFLCFAYRTLEFWFFYKPLIIGFTFMVFIALENRRISPSVALRKIGAWLRGPHVPCLPTRCHRSLQVRRK